MIRVSRIACVAVCLLLSAQSYAQPNRGEPAVKPDFSGIWQRSGSVISLLKLTEEGKVRSQATGVFDDPVVRCEGQSIARAGQSSFQVTKIEQADDSITFRWEQNAISNKVYWDGETPSETVNAQSVSYGTWKGSVLFVESFDFDPQAAVMAAGVPDSGTVFHFGEGFKLLERLEKIDDNTIDYMSVWVNPEILEWPRIIHTQWTRLPDDTFFYPSECQYDPETDVFEAE